MQGGTEAKGEPLSHLITYSEAPSELDSEMSNSEDTTVPKTTPRLASQGSQSSRGRQTHFQMVIHRSSQIVMGEAHTEHQGDTEESWRL